MSSTTRAEHTGSSSSSGRGRESGGRGGGEDGRGSRSLTSPHLHSTSARTLLSPSPNLASPESTPPSTAPRSSRRAPRPTLPPAAGSSARPYGSAHSRRQPAEVPARQSAAALAPVLRPRRSRGGVEIHRGAEGDLVSCWAVVILSSPRRAACLY